MTDDQRAQWTTAKTHLCQIGRRQMTDDERDYHEKLIHREVTVETINAETRARLTAARASTPSRDCSGFNPAHTRIEWAILGSGGDGGFDSAGGVVNKRRQHGIKRNFRPNFL